MCRWCGLLIRDDQGVLDTSKTFCGTPCKTHYQLRADPTKMREHVFFRDAGVCAACGTKHQYLDGDWEADHVKALMVAYGDPEYWEPDNVVILCTKPCHVKKSRQDRQKYRKEYRLKVREILDEIED